MHIGKKGASSFWWQRYGFRLGSGAAPPPSAGNNIPSDSSEASLHSWSYYSMFKDALFVIDPEKSAGDTISESHSTMISKLQLQPFKFKCLLRNVRLGQVSGQSSLSLVWNIPALDYSTLGPSFQTFLYSWPLLALAETLDVIIMQ